MTAAAGSAEHRSRDRIERRTNRSAAGALPVFLAVPGAAVGFADHEATRRIDLVQGHRATLTAGKRRDAGRLLIMTKTQSVLRLGDKALGRGISQRIGAVEGGQR